jgi:hypothetical protein
VSALLSYFNGLAMHMHYLSACAPVARHREQAGCFRRRAAKAVRFSMAKKATNLLHFTRRGVHSR